MIRLLLIAYIAGEALLGLTRPVSAVAADFRRERAPIRRETAELPPVRILPPCEDKLKWLLRGHHLLRCAPRVYARYARPNDPAVLNMLKTIGPPGRPYPEIFREEFY